MAVTRLSGIDRYRTRISLLVYADPVGVDELYHLGTLSQPSCLHQIPVSLQYWSFSIDHNSPKGQISAMLRSYH